VWRGPPSQAEDGSRGSQGGKPDVLDALFILPTSEVRKRSRRQHRVGSDCGFPSGEYNLFERGSLIGDLFFRGSLCRVSPELLNPQHFGSNCRRNL